MLAVLSKLTIDFVNQTSIHYYKLVGMLLITTFFSLRFKMHILLLVENMCYFVVAINNLNIFVSSFTVDFVKDPGVLLDKMCVCVCVV